MRMFYVWTILWNGIPICSLPLMSMALQLFIHWGETLLCGKQCLFSKPFEILVADKITKTAIEIHCAIEGDSHIPLILSPL